MTKQGNEKVEPAKFECTDLSSKYGRMCARQFSRLNLSRENEHRGENLNSDNSEESADEST